MVPASNPSGVDPTLQECELLKLQSEGCTLASTALDGKSEALVSFKRRVEGSPVNTFLIEHCGSELVPLKVHFQKQPEAQLQMNRKC